MEPKWQRIQFMPATPLGADGLPIPGAATHFPFADAACAVDLG